MTSRTTLIIGVSACVYVVVVGLLVRLLNDSAAPHDDLHNPPVVIVKPTSPSVAATSYETTARSVIAYSFKDDTALIAKDADVQLPLASLTKLATALVARTYAEETITIGQASIRDGDVAPLPPGYTFSKKDLIDYSLVASSNSASDALARSVGRAQGARTPEDELAVFQAVARSYLSGLQIPTLIVEDPTGLDLSTSTAGGYASSRDIARLAEHILTTDPMLLAKTDKPSITISSKEGLTFTSSNTDILLPKVPGLIAGKTGFTDIAGGNLLVVYDRSIGDPVAVVVLGSTKEGRFEEVLKIIREVGGR
jgi:D-alanyl-D-alanine endopeptidase (penicillin-binding protein 7)